MEEFWDERYSQEEFAYGKEPNEYIKAKLSLLPPGKILFPGEGEGRNAVYAARLGWDVSAFDLSTNAKAKADQLARSQGVTIDYRIHRFFEESYAQHEFDVIGLTYIHPSPDSKKQIHERIDSYLKVGGYIVLEAFSKEHREINRVNPAAGGPSDIDRLYSVEEIKEAFPNYEVIELKSETIDLNEGFGHVGKSSVVRFFGRKKAVSLSQGEDIHSLASHIYAT